MGLYFHFQIQPQLSFPRWPIRFILSVAISNCPLLFPGSILDIFRNRGLIFRCHIFLLFYTVHGVLAARILEWFAFPPSVDYVLSELSAMTCPSWVALLSMAHSFIEFHKLLCHDKAVIREGDVQYISIYMISWWWQNCGDRLLWAEDAGRS